jgi:hypothetical protein
MYTEWAEWEAGGEDDESRDIAARKMEDCYWFMLDTLDVSELNLRSLPKTLPPLLTTIHADHNQLERLPRLPSNLKTLIVDHNNLIDLPEHWPESLELIDLGNNPFTHLPDAITALSSLCNIYLENHFLPAERLQQLRERVRASNDGPGFFDATIEEGPSPELTT